MGEHRHSSGNSHSKPAFFCTEPRELAESRLRSSAYSDLRRLSCAYHAGVLTVHGHLPSYYLKQVALAVIATVDGVRQIDDKVKVGKLLGDRNDSA
jgi:hypothetical protein